MIFVPPNCLRVAGRLISIGQLHLLELPFHLASGAQHRDDLAGSGVAG